MLRAQVRDIARQVAQFEERLKINDLLNEIRSDLRHRVQNIKTVLGEETVEPEDENAEPDVKDNAALEKTGRDGSRSPLRALKKKYYIVRRNKINNSPSPSINANIYGKSGNEKRWKMLSMTNKTPFWNEHSQVYQVSIYIFLIYLS